MAFSEGLLLHLLHLISRFCLNESSINKVTIQVRTSGQVTSTHNVSRSNSPRPNANGLRLSLGLILHLRHTADTRPPLALIATLINVTSTFRGIVPPLLPLTFFEYSPTTAHEVPDHRSMWSHVSAENEHGSGAPLLCERLDGD